jgi:hypothetical protein
VEVWWVAKASDDQNRVYLPVVCPELYGSVLSLLWNNILKNHHPFGLESLGLRLCC